MLKTNRINCGQTKVTNAQIYRCAGWSDISTQSSVEDFGTVRQKCRSLFSSSFYEFLSLIDVLFFGHHYFIFGKLVDLLHSLYLNFGVQKQTISISVFMVSIVNFYVIWGYLFNYLKCFTMIINIINGSATNCGPVHWRTLADVVHLRSGTASTHCYWQCQWRN